MATRLNIRLEGGANLRRALAKMNPQQNQQILRRSLRQAAVLVVANAKNVQIRRGGGAVHPTKLTHRNVGAGLGSSIGPDFHGLPRYAEAGTDVFYGGIHEKGGTFKRKGGGTVTFPPRPFMEPALEAIRPQIPAIVVRHWKREGGL